MSSLADGTACLSYVEKVPSPDVASSVGRFWQVTAEREAEDLVPPDGCLDLIYSQSFGLMIIGAMTRAQLFTLSPGTITTGLRFRPGRAGCILGIRAADLTDSNVSAVEVWGKRGRELQSRLAGMSEWEDRWILFEGLVRERQQPPTPVQQAIRALTLSRGQMDLTAVAVSAGLSARHFRRSCVEETGLSPKQLGRILRFRYAQRLASINKSQNWADIAALAGYFDQAHLIRDWNHLLGRTPMAVLSNTESVAPP
jgi:AraC-like DNA-binding protein